MNAASKRFDEVLILHRQFRSIKQVAYTHTMVLGAIIFVAVDGNSVDEAFEGLLRLPGQPHELFLLPHLLTDLIKIINLHFPLITRIKGEPARAQHKGLGFGGLGGGNRSGGRIKVHGLGV